MPTHVERKRWRERNLDDRKQVEAVMKEWEFWNATKTIRQTMSSSSLEKNLNIYSESKDSQEYFTSLSPATRLKDFWSSTTNHGSRFAKTVAPSTWRDCRSPIADLEATEHTPDQSSSAMQQVTQSEVNRRLEWVFARIETTLFHQQIQMSKQWKNCARRTSYASSNCLVKLCCIAPYISILQNLAEICSW